jgi:NADPH-dependent 2,4-dienoyl-CoA reductase/sulfur reductase-like enzyme
VLQIDTLGRRIHVRRVESGSEYWEPYDQLMIATGARPICPDVPGSDGGGIFGVNGLQSAIEIQKELDLTGGVRQAVVVGGGYIGLEMAEAMALRGLKVALVEQASEVMNMLDGDMAAKVSQVLEDGGVALYRAESLQAFEGGNGRVAAVITDQRKLPADIVILGLGVQPNTELAEAAAIPLGAKNGIVVDERMHTEVPGIWAAGDCVQSQHLVSGKPFYVALGTVANKQGRVAGINIGGGRAVFPGAMGTAITKVFDLGIARTGLQAAEIESLGWDYAAAKIDSRHRTGYYPDAGRITVKLLARKGGGQLLGGQIVGSLDGVKRIDTIATALHAGFTVDRLLDLDLSYAPPFSPVWDPVQIAARQLIKKI